MEYIRLEQEGYLTLLTIDRPKALNALNAQVLNELSEALDQINTQETRVIIITGAGEKSFVAGADIDYMRPLDEKQGSEFGRFGNDVMRKIETFPLPVIAAVNGYALGGGNELAMACDIRLASDNAIFGQPEVGLGITAGFGGTQRLARLIGSLSMAKQILYSAANIDAMQAKEIGLVSAVYPQAELLEQAKKLARKIAKNAPIAVRKTKEAINDGLQVSIEEGIDLEVKLFGSCFATADQKEGMSAFLEKRKDKNFTNQ